MWMSSQGGQLRFFDSVVFIFEGCLVLLSWSDILFIHARGADSTECLSVLAKINK